MKKIGIVVVTQAIGWGIISLVDFYTEITRNDVIYPAVFGVPAMCLVLYLILRRKIYGVQASRLEKWKFIGIWFGVSLMLGVMITFMTCEWNNWIVHQATGGWENFLNGIEYPLFGIIFGPFLSLIVGLMEAVIALANIMDKERLVL